MADKYSSYALDKDNFELGPTVGEGFERSKPHIDSYTVTGSTDTNGFRYKISAKFSFDTPLGYFIPFLESGGSVTFTRDGLQKRIVLETEDGSKGS